MEIKLAYVKPELKAHGSVEDVTQANTTGTKLDFTFVAGTPLTSLTLS